MDLKDIISIGGKSGLFKVLTRRKNELIVLSIADKKKHFIYALDRVSALEDISIYTHDDNLPLIEVFEKLVELEKGEPTINPKSNPELLKQKLAEIVPDYDEDRVYNSDIKKLFQWYNLLIEAEILSYEPQTNEEKQATNKNEKQ